MTLPEKLQEIIEDFKSLDDRTEKYEELLHYATKLPAMPGELKTKENLVPGCQSIVHVYVEVIDGKLNIVADADSHLVKGLCAILVLGLQDMQAQDFLNLTPDFIAEFGLAESLSPNRANASLNIFTTLQQQVKEQLAAGQH